MKQQEEQLKIQRERAEQERIRLAEEKRRFVRMAFPMSA